MKTEKEIAAYNVIREQHRLLGPMSFGEISVLCLFILLVLLWFTRDPGFVSGWATDIFNSQAEFVYIFLEKTYNSTPNFYSFIILLYKTVVLFDFCFHSILQVCIRCHGGSLCRSPSLCSALQTSTLVFF